MSFHRASAKDFQKIPGSPVAYWVEESLRNCFVNNPRLKEIGDTRQGMATSNNDKFLRIWHEISLTRFHPNCISREDSVKKIAAWVPYNKGGGFRKWWGNQDYVLNWINDGEAVIGLAAEKYGSPTRTIKSISQYFLPSNSWSKISSGSIAFRHFPKGFIFDVAGCCVFYSNSCDQIHNLGFLNSNITSALLKATSPTLNYEAGHIASLPFCIDDLDQQASKKCVNQLTTYARTDWDNYETSWDFTSHPLLRSHSWKLDNEVTGTWKGDNLEASWNNWKRYCDSAIARMQELETENNRLWIDAYGLKDELTPEVPEKEITLGRADRAKDMAAFLSYAVGCMMGRFSLDAEGLIMANSGETLEDYVEKVRSVKCEVKSADSEYSLDDASFMPDDDGIIPVLDGEWFADDVVGRTVEFLRVTFGEASLDANIRFIEESLGKSLRKYFLNDFYKNHISNERAYGYKKRPIYWLVQSPKKSFQALIYLHRYTKDTMNLVLNNYLREYESKLQNRLEQLAITIASESTSGSDKTKAQKETDKIKASLTELDAWEKDTLFPIASARIELDLDDGVKANYPKLGNTLAKIPGVSA